MQKGTKFLERFTAFKRTIIMASWTMLDENFEPGQLDPRSSNITLHIAFKRGHQSCCISQNSCSVMMSFTKKPVVRTYTNLHCVPFSSWAWIRWDPASNIADIVSANFTPILLGCWALPMACSNTDCTGCGFDDDGLGFCGWSIWVAWTRSRFCFGLLPFDGLFRVFVVLR